MTTLENDDQPFLCRFNLETSFVQDWPFSVAGEIPRDGRLNTTGIGRFAECRTRQKGLGEQYIGKGFFVECQTVFGICRVPDGTRQKKRPSRRRVIEAALPSVCVPALDKGSTSGSLCQVLC
jgi:hypothetical protein